ncbi:hypothetical protein IGI04_037485 [Brassica rapa subsp. trilocularis]|uniref:Uncharacterized protein n=1 Tax=Brassica rapa subsp. trilocularis TaxID=1813537 RepID=A0ABQ7LJ71_BRACM|nr:hypothetical protein IGI04_037485 [Brassica rapa subsp. trilocularis]
MMVLHRLCEGALFLGGRNVRCGGKLIGVDILLLNSQVWCKDSRGDKQTNAWLGAAGHALRTEWTVFKIRQALQNSVFN